MFLRFLTTSFKLKRHFSGVKTVFVINNAKYIRFYSSKSRYPRIIQNSPSDVVTVGIIVSGFLFLLYGLAHLSVPFYRHFCGNRTFGYDAKRLLDNIGIVPDERRRVKVRLNGSVSKKLPWEFKPEHPFIDVIIGEPALAFFYVKNKGPEAYVGMSSYTISPDSAATCFYKIQCFCFEEQRLEPGDEVVMPVFFYIDPKFDETVDNLQAPFVELSYKFYKSINNDVVNEQVEEFKENLAQEEYERSKEATATAEISL